MTYPYRGAYSHMYFMNTGHYSLLYHGVVIWWFWINFSKVMQRPLCPYLHGYHRSTQQELPNADTVCLA